MATSLSLFRSKLLAGFTPKQAPAFHYWYLKEHPLFANQQDCNLQKFFLWYRSRSERRSKFPKPHAMDPEKATVLVTGGGGVGLEVVKLLRDLGTRTYMLQRSDIRREELEALNVVIVKADALDYTNLEEQIANIDGLDAVVSALGGTKQDPQVDSAGNMNLIKAALKSKVQRFVMVSSVGAGGSIFSVKESGFKYLEPILIEKTKAEEELKSHEDEIEYVIIRPAHLFSKPATGCGILTEDVDVGGQLHREDCAKLLVKALFSDRIANKVLHAVDKNQARNLAHPDKQLEIFEL